ncbi:MAG: HPr family phosphocarrier protein [Pseudomonadota bacterium]
MSDQASTSVKISNRLGLHARASAKFCKTASAFDAEVSVSKDGFTVRGDSVLDLLMLVAHKGSDIKIVADGPQAAEAVETLRRLVEDRFGEPD